MDTNVEVATFGSGCFWCTEAMFRELKGVKTAVSGYMGGKTKNPTYREVCSGTTGHAEVIQVSYFPDQISYTDLLNVFWSTHDPTTLNRQGNDVGTQYRSVIFYHTLEQKKMALQSMSDIAKELWDDPIVTEITPADTFYPAEDYHQDYYRLNPNQGYCRSVISPKMAKFRKNFVHKLKMRADV